MKTLLGVVVVMAALVTAPLSAAHVKYHKHHGKAHTVNVHVHKAHVHKGKGHAHKVVVYKPAKRKRQGVGLVVRLPKGVIRLY